MLAPEPYGGLPWETVRNPNNRRDLRYFRGKTNAHTTLGGMIAMHIEHNSTSDSQLTIKQEQRAPLAYLLQLPAGLVSWAPPLAYLNRYGHAQKDLRGWAGCGAASPFEMASGVIHLCNEKRHIRLT